MPSTPPTRGAIGRLVAGAETVEIKATIAHTRVRDALKFIGVREAGAERRFIYFFDTMTLSLFTSGVIVRARRISGKTHDSTVKIRPVGAKDVAAKWQKEKGFKLEADAGTTHIVRSASLTRTVSKGLIKTVEADAGKLSGLFDAKQQLFLAEMCRTRHDLDKLVILGPTEALWWKIAHKGLPWPMTAELWIRADGATVLEASVRVPVAQAAVAKAGFAAFLAELGAQRDDALQAKTRWALEYYAGKVPARGAAKPGGPPAAARRRKTGPSTRPQRAAKLGVTR